MKSQTARILEITGDDTLLIDISMANSMESGRDISDQLFLSLLSYQQLLN